MSDGTPDFALLSRPIDLSLVLPVRDYRQELPAHLENFFSFWTNTPLQIELVFALRGGDLTSTEDPWSTLKRFTPGSKIQSLILPKNVQLTLINLPNKISRGRAVLSGLRAAQGKWIATSSIDCSWPLGEVLRAYIKASEAQNHTDPISPKKVIRLWVANRKGRKTYQGEKIGLRRIFEEIEHDKSKNLKLQDPTSPYFLVEKESLDLILTKLPEKTIRPWFYAPKFYLAARRLNVPIDEIDIATQNQSQSAFGFWDIF